MDTVSSNAEVWDTLLAAAPAAARSRLEKIIGADRPPLLDFLMKAMDSAGAPARPGPLSSAVMENGLLIGAILNPALLPLDQAIELARAAAGLDPRLDYNLLASLTNSSRNWPHDIRRVELMRALQVIDAVSDCQRLVIPLMKFVKLPNRHLRSKVVKLLARASRNASWADSIFQDADPRVRSNLIESIAEQLGQHAVPLLRKGARDSHHRVAVTSLLALSRMGDAGSLALLEKMGAEGDEAQRRAAAWALRKLAEKPANPSTAAPRPTV